MLYIVSCILCLLIIRHFNFCRSVWSSSTITITLRCTYCDLVQNMIHLYLVSLILSLTPNHCLSLFGGSSQRTQACNLYFTIRILNKEIAKACMISRCNFNNFQTVEVTATLSIQCKLYHRKSLHTYAKRKLSTRNIMMLGYQIV